MPQPNIVLIMADQLRADFLGCYGAGFVRTPHIDSLAAQGVCYTRAYSTSPICVPARASLLTGMNAIQNGVTSNSQWLRPDLRALGIKTWPERLAEAGYYTAAVGKMHFYPWDSHHGFQYKVAAEDKRWIHIRDDYYRFLREHGFRKLHGSEHEGYFEHKGAIINRLPWEFSVDHFVGQEARRFIRTYGDEQPFAMMVSFPGPHCPYDPNAEFLDRVDPAAMPEAVPYVEANTARLRAANVEGNRLPWNGVDYSDFTAEHKRKIRAHYAAEVEQIDYEVGQVVSALRDQGLLENTVIVFTSDHGDYLGDHDLIGKGTFYEGSIHIPLIVRPAGGIAAQTVDNLAALTDLTATLLAWAGLPRPAYMDSQPLPGLGLPDSDPREALVGMTASGWMLYDGRWKLCKYATGDVHLFDLAQDPHEQVNHAHDPACLDRLLAMDARLTQEIMRSIVSSHHDKALDTREAYWGTPVYGKQGWRRVYPHPFAESPGDPV